MKQWKGVRRFFLLSCVCTLLTGQSVFAGTGGNEKSYTYTVTLYSGNQGTFADTQGVQVDNHATGSAYQIINPGQENDKIRITGLEYGDRIIINAQADIALKETSKYYVKGIRESGHDNNTVGASAFFVESDREYVVAYGIKGDMIPYVVNYQDAEGNTLAESQTFYGVVGEQPVVAFRYFEGYRPQAYNLTKTLSKNEAENVFNFVYEAVSGQTVPGQGTGDGGANGNIGAGGTAALNGNNGNTGNLQGTAGNGTPAGNNGNAVGNTTPVGNAGNGNADAQETPGADGLVAEEEEQTPKELINLDDEETPLAEIDAQAANAKVSQKIPIWIGIAAVVLVVAGVFTIRVWKKRKSRSEKKREGKAEKEEKK